MLLRSIAAIAILTLVVGCQLFNPIAPIIQIGIMWYEGEAHKYYATKQETIHEATKAVLAKFTLPIVEEKVDGNTIYIQAGDDDRFKIKITSVRENVTKLSIRINIMGDKPYTEMLYRHIDEYNGVEQFATVTSLNDALDNQKRRFRR